MIAYFSVYDYLPNVEFCLFVIAVNLYFMNCISTHHHHNHHYHKKPKQNVVLLLYIGLHAL